MDADAVLSWLERLVNHASGSALVLSYLFGWAFMLICMFPIKKVVKEDEMATWLNRITCVASSIGMARLMWPPMLEQYRWGWALSIGMTSPALWWCVTHLVAYKFPALAGALKLKRVSLDSDDNIGAENDVRPTEPRPDAP